MEINVYQQFTLSIYLLSCFFVAGICQFVVLKKGYLRSYSFPADFNLEFRSKRLFGANKTLLGIVCMMLFTACSFTLISNALEFMFHTQFFESPKASQTLVGAVLGLFYMLGELPNSFMKRQCDIAPGQTAEHPFLRKIFIVIDQIDSVLAATMASFLFYEVQGTFVVMTVFLGFLLHWGFNLALFYFKVKDAPL